MTRASSIVLKFSSVQPHILRSPVSFGLNPPTIAAYLPTALATKTPSRTLRDWIEASRPVMT